MRPTMAQSRPRGFAGVGEACASFAGRFGTDHKICVVPAKVRAEPEWRKRYPDSVQKPRHPRNRLPPCQSFRLRSRSVSVLFLRSCSFSCASSRAVASVERRANRFFRLRTKCRAWSWLPPRRYLRRKKRTRIHTTIPRVRLTSVTVTAPVRRASNEPLANRCRRAPERFSPR